MTETKEIKDLRRDIDLLEREINALEDDLEAVESENNILRYEADQTAKDFSRFRTAVGEMLGHSAFKTACLFDAILLDELKRSL